MSKDIKFIPRLNADLELKKLGTIMGLSIYVDMAGIPAIDDERKFSSYLQIQKMLADFFNPPEEAFTEDSDAERQSKDIEGGSK